MDTIKIRVNGVELSAPKCATILQAVQQANVPYAEIEIPTLHYLKDVLEQDQSGVCLVEVAGREGLIPAWSCVVEEGMEVSTECAAAVSARKEALEKILAVHDHDCVNCTRTGNCELQYLLYRYEVDEESRRYNAFSVDDSAIIVRDANKCIRCRRCVSVCENVQGVGAIQAVGEGLEAVVGPVSAGGLNDTKCVNCGQCVAVCPVGALRERDNTDQVLDVLADPSKFVVAQVAPAVRAALGEAIEGFPIGVDVEGRLAAALRALGFDKAFDTQFGADLTIAEEAREFVDRLSGGGVLPMMTSCCPGWIKFCEHEFPDMLPHISSCKSPHQMLGAVVKSYYAEKLGKDKKDVVVVSIMPCTAKKFEIHREHEDGAGVPDVDIAITTRELARLLRRAEIPFEAMPTEKFDEPLGLSTGAAVIFGASGGVMEAALRTAAEELSGQPLSEVDFKALRGTAGLKEAELSIGRRTVRVAAVSGLAQARALLESIRAGNASYDFIEVMACPGGCVNGGGQPIQPASVRAATDLRAVRAQALYENDGNRPVRQSHKNPALLNLYRTYLGKPGGEKAHQLLHTVYTPR